MTPEIRAFEFALGLFSVLIGLAVADVATSFHRLVRHRAPVKWDPQTLLAAGYALLMAIGMWFDLWGIRNVAASRHFFFYLCLVAPLFVLFLIAAASLPDETSAPIDLPAYCAGNRRYFWLLVTIFQGLYIALGLYFVAGLLSRAPPIVAISFYTQMSVLFVVAAALIWLRPRWAHLTGLVALDGVNIWHYAPYAIN